MPTKPLKPKKRFPPTKRSFSARGGPPDGGVALLYPSAPTIMVSVLGKRGFKKKETVDRLRELSRLFDQHIYDYALNPELREAFDERCRHAETVGRDPDAFIKDETAALKELAKQAARKQEKLALAAEARRRRRAGESFADKVLDEYRQRIEEYPVLHIHEDADIEVSKLFGALARFYDELWNPMEAYLRKAFPQRGQLDRMDLDQRVWRLVPAREGRLPADLERYAAVLHAPSSSNREKTREAQECIKTAAFFLHDVIDVFGRAKNFMSEDKKVENGMKYVHDLISNFRLKDLKRR